MAPTKKSLLSTSDARRTFRAAAGLTIDQQLQKVSQLQAQGDDVLRTIRRMEKVSKNQKQATKTNNLKFEWLEDHSHLKRLEENCSKELETLLLRMYNEASTAQESTVLRQQKGPCSACNDEDNKSNDVESNEATLFVSSSAIYAAELEDLIRTEQLSRVGLIKQITSECEQRAALNQLLSALRDTDIHPTNNNQLPWNDMQNNVHQLVYDAIIGRQMIEATLEEELQLCEKDYNACYEKVLEALRDGSNSAGESLHDQEEQIAAVLEAAGRNECPDEMLRLEISQDIRQLFAELHDDLAQYKHDFIAAVSTIDTASTKCGGWNDSDEKRFLEVLRSYENKYGSGKNPQLLYAQLALVLPNVPPIEIKKHVKFHQHVRFHHKKRKDRQRDFERRLRELQAAASAKFQIAKEQEEEKMHRMKRLSVLKHQCEQKHEQVSQWRLTKDAKARIESQQRKLEHLFELQKQQDEELQWRRKLEHQKIAIGEYRKEKALERMAHEKLRMDEEQQQEEKCILQRVVNAERVQYRQDAFQRKVEETMQEELHKAQLEEERLKKLDELKETTPYAQIIANITTDPKRTRQETAAFRSNVESIQEGPLITETGLFPSHGYDCETLFKNARFKLGIALRNAGLNSSEYARQALAHVKVCNVGAYRNHVAEPTKLW